MSLYQTAVSFPVFAIYTIIQYAVPATQIEIACRRSLDSIGTSFIILFSRKNGEQKKKKNMQRSTDLIASAV